MRGHNHGPHHDRRPTDPAALHSACGTCTSLLRDLANAFAAPPGGWVEQLVVARHIAAEHPDEVPPAHLEGCEICPQYARADSGTAPYWAEHRARELYLPERIARLL
ncbi:MULTISPECIES: hypothetical protein [unclassified Streptomyces]|uniref:hypothetical protein n=1 Tax=unclassified Streptomyces TaxID=2593676 RepID=UPI0037FD5B47